MQANDTAYCEPRRDFGPYTQYEVGFPMMGDEPTTLPADWAEYADGSHPSNVYGYVPVEMIQELIDSHGGIDIAKSYSRHERSLISYEKLFRMR